MKICIRTGDVPEFPADVLVSTANPWLDMSGGVNGAIRAQCPEIQDELKSHLKEQEIRALPAGSIVRTSAGTLPFQAILHAIAIDPFYSTSKQIINSILNELMVWTVPQGLHSISMPPPGNRLRSTADGRLRGVVRSVHAMLQRAPG